MWRKRFRVLLSKILCTVYFCHKMAKPKFSVIKYNQCSERKTSYLRKKGAKTQINDQQCQCWAWVDDLPKQVFAPVNSKGKEMSWNTRIHNTNTLDLNISLTCPVRMQASDLKIEQKNAGIVVTSYENLTWDLTNTVDLWFILWRIYACFLCAPVFAMCNRAQLCAVRRLETVRERHKNQVDFDLTHRVDEFLLVAKSRIQQQHHYHQQRMDGRKESSQRKKWLKPETTPKEWNPYIAPIAIQ